LTLLPKVWSIRKIEEEFPDTYNYKIHTAKQLLKDYGIPASPNPKPGRSLDPEVAYTVEKFYCNDSVSIVVPGKKDCVAVKKLGVQKNTNRRD
jgi:hypothetical protein